MTGVQTCALPICFPVTICWVVGTGVYIDNEEKELKAKALNEISKIRFGQDGYFFVYDYDGTNIMHPINPSLVGKNLIENKSQKCRKINDSYTLRSF